MEQAIRRVESEAREADSRTAELGRAGFGSNRGPRLESIEPVTETPQPTRSINPREAIAAYRSATGLPDVGTRPARATTEGTVAFTQIDGRLIFGVNSKAAGYTSNDEVAAMKMRSLLIERHPGVMSADHLGHFPNNALFHAEANVLLRAAEQFGGTLAGRTIEVHVDRSTCRDCLAVVPIIALEVGNPTLRIVPSAGPSISVRNGVWSKGEP